MGVETHERKNHVCKLKEDLYELIRNPWDNTYIRRLMKILTFATRLNPIEDDKLTDGCKTNASKDRGSWYPVILDGYHTW